MERPGLIELAVYALVLTAALVVVVVRRFTASRAAQAESATIVK